MGYSDLRDIAGVTCGLSPYLFTTGLVVGITKDGHQRRYCFEQHDDALQALITWNGEGHPTGPWIKCKGSGIDLLNPLWARG